MKRSLGLVAALLWAVPAGAVPLAISNPDLVWSSPAGSGPSSTLAVHLEDMADPRPDVGVIRMTLSGHVVQDFDADPWWGYVWRVALLLYPQDNSLLRVSPVHGYGDSESYPFFTDAFNTWEDIFGQVERNFAAVVYEVGPDGIERSYSTPLLDWHSTVILTVFDLGSGDPKTLTFLNHFRIATCARRQFCEIGPETVAGETTVQVTPIPEPSTALLVTIGLVGLAGWRSGSRR